MSDTQFIKPWGQHEAFVWCERTQLCVVFYGLDLLDRMRHSNLYGSL